MKTIDPIPQSSDGGAVLREWNDGTGVAAPASAASPASGPANPGQSTEFTEPHRGHSVVSVRSVVRHECDRHPQ